MPNASLIAQRNKYENLEKQRESIIEQGGGRDSFDIMAVADFDGDFDARAGAMKSLDSEITEVKSQLDRMVELEAQVKSVPAPAAPAPQSAAPIVKDYGYDDEHRPIHDALSKAWRPSGGILPLGKEVRTQANLKTLFATTPGYAPESVRSGLIVPFASAPPDILDVVRQQPLNQEAYVYMEQTVRSDYAGAAITAENAAYAEHATEFDQKTVGVVKVTNSIPVTDEVMEDNPGSLPSFLTDDLVLGLRQRLSQQIVSGTGASGQIRGLLGYPTANDRTQPSISASSFSQIGRVNQGSTQTKLDALSETILRIEEEVFARPDMIIMSYRDWMEIEEMRTNTGSYIWSEPGMRPAKMFREVPVLCSFFIPSNTAIVGIFGQYARILDRRDVLLEYTNSHDEDFLHGRTRWRASLRAGFVLTRPGAFYRTNFTA